MKILVTVDPEIPVPPKFYGGIERIVDRLIHELRKRAHVVALLAHPDSDCPVDYLRAWPAVSDTPMRHASRALTLLRAVQSFRPQVVHSFSRLGYLLPILPQRLPKLMSYQRHTGGKQIRLAGKLGGKSLAFTGCSEFIAGMGRRWGSQWSAIPNFVDTDFYTFRATVAADAPLVFLSRLERIKGAHTAIAVARKAGRRLVLAGNRVTTEEGQAYWNTEIEPFLNKDGIEYVGPVNDEQKNKLLGSAAATIVPIEWKEPFGIVFAEALACGTPVVSCPHGALPEIVTNGKHGFLINNVAEGLEAVRRLGEIDRSECRLHVEERFSSKIVVDQYERLYSRLLAA